MKAALVMTTIHNPLILEGYARNFTDYGRKVEMIVIPDEKTPAEAATTCKKFGARLVPLEEQDSFLKNLNLPLSMFPRNTDHRRNIGYLLALDAGADFVMSIDDDNYASEIDLFDEHASCLDRNEMAVETDTGWLNPCRYLTAHSFEGTAVIYPRGFPYFARHKIEHYRISVGGEIHVNMGLWSGSPDVDALTTLTLAPQTTALNEDITVGHSTWMPINSQNTALRREAIAAYYYLSMRDGLDHFADIFQGYFLQKCMKAQGGIARFGSPVVKHIRNQRNYFTDLAGETPAICRLERMLPWLLDLKIDGSNYVELYLSLANEVRDWSKEWSTEMTMWANAVKEIG